MSKNYTEKEMEKLIIYWIEAVQMESMVSVIADNIDEAKEMYEKEMEEICTSSGQEDLFLAFLNDIKPALGRAKAIVKDISKSLMKMMEWAISERVGVWGKYPITVSKSTAREILNHLELNFDDIYAHHEDNLVGAFYEELDKILYDIHLWDYYLLEEDLDDDFFDDFDEGSFKEAVVNGGSKND